MTTSIKTMSQRNAIRKINEMAAQRRINAGERRIAIAIINRWEDDYSVDTVIKASIALYAGGVQWAFKIEKGYFLDTVRDELWKAQAN